MLEKNATFTTPTDGPRTIVIERIFQTNLKALQCCSHLVTTVLGGAFATECEECTVFVKGNVCRIFFTKAADKEFVNKITDELMSFISLSKD